MPLHDLDEQTGATPTAAVSAPEMLAIQYWGGFRQSGQLPSQTASSPSVPAQVNHGRWLTPCPFCNSANLASRADKRFLCCECGNTAAGGQWLPVVWPKNAHAIEEMLMKRPDRHTRNWLPGETVADLAAENKSNGVQ